QIASQYGQPVTFFVHPETAVAQAPMFRERATAGDCLGLHMHPWKYSLWRHAGKRYFAHYGSLSPAEQRALPVESPTVWCDAIGHLPKYFRPGTFSANDTMFQILADTGFCGGYLLGSWPGDP